MKISEVIARLEKIAAKYGPEHGDLEVELELPDHSGGRDVVQDVDVEFDGKSARPVVVMGP